MKQADFIENIVPEGTTEIRFVRNTPYEGVDYGPDYDEDTTFVESRQAAIWIQKGRAVAIETDDSQSVDSDRVPTRDELLKMRKDDLVALAVSRGIETVPDEMTKTQIVDLILENV